VSLLLGEEASGVGLLDELELAHLGRRATDHDVRSGGARSDPGFDEAGRLLAHDVVERVGGCASARADAPALFLQPAHHQLTHLRALLGRDDQLSLLRALAEDLRECGAECVLLRGELLHGVLRVSTLEQSIFSISYRQDDICSDE